MGCRYCSSGLGEDCEGPLGLDDLEVSCSCECHCCPECGSAYCVKMGGDEPCRLHGIKLEKNPQKTVWKIMIIGKRSDL